jgi:methylthioribose-1-phosphate isomerase
LNQIANESVYRNEIVEVGKKLYAKDFVASNDGNISIRISDNEILMTPTGVSKGAMTPDQIIKIDLEGKLLSGFLRPSSEHKMHLVIYQKRPEVKAVVHAHPPTVTGFAVAGIPFDDISLPEVVFNLGKIELSDYATPSTDQVPKVVATKIADCNALLLANHGAVTVGDSALEAYYRMETLEAVAKITFVAKTLGRVNYLNDRQKEELYEIRRRMQAGNIAGTNYEHCGPAQSNCQVAPEPLNDFWNSVKWEEDRLVILEQTKLPLETVYETLTDIQQVWDAIYLLKVRGAPAIGIAAGYGLYISVKDLATTDLELFRTELKKNSDYLNSSRPTAVNLFWALDRLGKLAQAYAGQSVAELKTLLLAEAHAIKRENEAICQSIAENGLPLLQDGMGILTHCNAGPVACASRYGTALGPVFLAAEKGMQLKLYADETRPLNQGSRLTAWELQQGGIDVTLICDDMTATVMAQGKVQAVIVGCDRVARNGDVANKIGTYGVAILAKEHQIPFYVAAPSSTIDLAIASGKEIVIEERPAKEITCGFGKRTAPLDIKVYNPAFDVTPAQYVTAIITEKGVIYPPFGPQLARLMA